VKLEPKKTMKRSYKAYSDSKYLAKADGTPPVQMTISNVEEAQVATPGKPAKLRLVLSFNETEKKLVLNMSHGDVLCEMSGSEDPSEWIGLRIELYVDENVSFQGKRIGGIRIRPPTGQPY